MNKTIFYTSNTNKINFKSHKIKHFWNVFTISLAILVPIALPLIHMIIFDSLWGTLKKTVNREECTCSCWDTIFKGKHKN